MLGDADTGWTRRGLWAGVLCAPWFLLSLIVFGALEPGYSHRYKAVSELGAFGVRYGLWMNLFGFLMTGVLVILAALAYHRVLKQASLGVSAAAWLLVLGVSLAGTAVPADMQAMMQSPWTVIHLAFSFFGLLPFAVAAILTGRRVRQLGVRPVASRVIQWLPVCLVPAFMLYGFTDQRGLVQRLTILLVLGWVGALCWGLLTRSGGTADHKPAAHAGEVS